MFLIAACRSLPQIPPNPLQLLSSQPLQLPAECVATQSIVIEFVIDTDGSPSKIAIAPAPACLQQALRTWVASFKYAPLPAALPTRVEWLLVTAPKL